MTVVAVAGAGQVGTAAGLNAVRGGYTKPIVYFDTNQTHLDQLCEVERDWGLHGAVRSTPDTEHFLEMVEHADLVVLATPQSAFKDMAAKVIKRMKAGAVLTDVGSLRCSAVRDIEGAMKASGRTDVFYFGSHPGTGNERQGPLAAEKDMYAGKSVFVQPLRTDASPEEKAAYQRFLGFWESQHANIDPKEPEAHDRFFGVTSHAEHVLGLSLGLSAYGGGVVRPEYKKAGTSLGATTRIIRGISWAMWAPVFKGNRAIIVEAMRGIQTFTTGIASCISHGDESTLKQVLRTAHAYRDSMRGLEARNHISRENIVGEMADCLGRSVSTNPSAEAMLAMLEKKNKSDTFARVALLPYVLGVAATLNARKFLAADVDLTQHANPSFLDGSAPALNDPAMMTQLLIAQKESILPVIEEYRLLALGSLMQALETGDNARLEKLVDKARTACQQLPVPRRAAPGCGTATNQEVRPEYVILSRPEGQPYAPVSNRALRQG